MTDQHSALDYQNLPFLQDMGITVSPDPILVTGHVLPMPKIHYGNAWRDVKNPQSALQSCLTVCLLSPNITVYVTDTHMNIMDFIKNHCEVFKLPAALMQDVELLAQLSKIISELLSSIRGNLKSKLVISIAKHMSIMDTAKSLAHSVIEVEACHWNRYTFLWHCLQIFLIGVSDYKAIPLNDLYSSSLIPSLHKDLCIKIAMTLDCEVGTEADENGKQHGDRLEDSMDHLDGQGSEAQPGVSNDTGGNGDLGEGGHVMDTREEDQFCENHDEEAGQQEPDKNYNDDNDNNDDNDSGSEFSKRKNGKGPKFTLAKFWNFVDCSLEAIHKAAREEAGPAYMKSACRTYKNAVQKEMDLVEFPGSMVIPKLLKTTSPQWQTTIQDSLLWG
ncbi:hypothetical protein BDR04DRAFT_1164525 [Suillus decipiens]|nr:hypothetical protein BDR04DRAFT_1164525 [Suillus decipiens]